MFEFILSLSAADRAYRYRIRDLRDLGWKLPKLNESVLDPRDGEKARDHGRRLFAGMMQEELGRFWPVTIQQFSHTSRR
jgi:hypothetical protein